MDKLEQLMEALSNYNTLTKDDVESFEVIDENNFAGLEHIDPNTSFYSYEGPMDDKTRPFCAFMLKSGKLFTQENLDDLSSLLGYDVFLYVAGFNCRHEWKRLRIKKKLEEGYDPETPSKGNINRAAVKQPNDLGQYFSKQIKDIHFNGNSKA